MQKSVSVKRALISVSDKTNLIDFAQQLHKIGVEILSTGGTAKELLRHDIPVKNVSEYTQFPEIMGGRVKTLHPKIHGAILGRRDVDKEVMQEHDIDGIDLVVVNLYPFQQTVAKKESGLIDAIENIDIGGPAMLRAAAKNHNDVAGVVDCQDYPLIIKSLQGGGITLDTRFHLATKAFAHTAQYDGAIANYLGKFSALNETQDFSSTLNQQFILQQNLRYGENPHQKAAFYTTEKRTTGNIANAHQKQGKPLSYNNIADTDAALECVKQFETPACVIVKHANPCGVGIAENIQDAYQKAYTTDTESAFGGVIAFNQHLDASTLKRIIKQQFVEVIIAPSLCEDALKICEEKQNLRLLSCGALSNEHTCEYELKQVNGGVLVQSNDNIDYQNLQIVSERQPDAQQMNDLLFAWKVAKFVKSNAIVYAKNEQTIGIGAGQMSRINSARIAGIKAEHAKLSVEGAVMASDAFFPFRDGIDNAAKSGISAVIQPGGSMRDDEVIQAANEHDMVMLFTSTRHFRH